MLFACAPLNQQALTGILSMKKNCLWQLTIVLLLAAIATRATEPQHAPQPHGAWLFIYFKEPGNQGIYFALSRDGYHYTPLNDGQPWLAPSQSGELMRDVFLTRGPDHLFHMVWTWNWRGNSLGYASPTCSPGPRRSKSPSCRITPKPRTSRRPKPTGTRRKKNGSSSGRVQ